MLHTRNHGGIHKVDPTTFIKRHHIHQYHQVGGHTGHEFHITVIRDSRGENPWRDGP